MDKELVLACAYHWWRGDPLPQLPPLAGFETQIVDDAALLARLHELDEATIRDRFDEDNHCYLAYLDGAIAGYGWVGAKIGRIHEIGLQWPLSENDRHLWDFVTLPAWRGRGVYPHLLQTILRAESKTAERFWIGHQGNNTASQRGIVKAGFDLHRLTVLMPEGHIQERHRGDVNRALADPMWPVLKSLTLELPPEMAQQLRQQFEGQ